jgi:Flp pilus assembly protein TadG
MRIAMLVQREHGQSTVFFASFVVILAVLTAVVLEVGRLAYARGEVAKAADAAALAAASRVDIAQYRDTGQILFQPDVYTYAQGFAAANSAYLERRSIPYSVSSIRLDNATRVVAVSVSANLSPLLPPLLQGGGVVTVTGYAQARVNEK